VRRSGMRASSSAAPAGPIQRLHLALLVHTQHHRFFGRIVVEANDIDDFGHELWVGRQLEPVDQVRFEIKSAPDPSHRRGDSPTRVAIERGAKAESRSASLAVFARNLPKYVSRFTKHIAQYAAG
jgi:hypothetical protein